MTNTTDNSLRTNLKKETTSFRHIFERLENIEQHKKELLHVFKNLDSAKETLSKIQSGKIIIQKERQDLCTFIGNMGLSKQINNARSENKDATTIEDMEKIIGIVKAYPYVVDADSISDAYAPYLDGIIQIRKDDKIGLIKKGETGIMYLLAPNKYEGKIILVKTLKDFEKCKTLEINNPSNRGSIWAIESIFLEMIGGEPRIFDCIGRFHLVCDFDADGIAIAIKEPGKYYFVRKNFADPDKPKVSQLGNEFTCSIDNAQRGFDVHNALDVAGRLIFRKRYENGSCVAIEAFNKSLFGNESLINRYRIR